MLECRSLCSYIYPFVYIGDILEVEFLGQKVSFFLRLPIRIVMWSFRKDVLLKILTKYM